MIARLARGIFGVPYKKATAQEEAPVIVPDPPTDASHAEKFTPFQNGIAIGYGVTWYAGGPVTLMIANEALFWEMLADGVRQEKSSLRGA